jgi:cytochrome c oxidase cbb3-type subunit 1
MYMRVGFGGETYAYLTLAFLLGLAGLLMLSAGEEGVMVMHGVIVFAAALYGFYKLIAHAYSTQPLEPVALSYNDSITRVAIVLTVIWALIGFGVGDWLAWQLAFPDLNFDSSWTNFGRVRPVHTTSVIWGFGGNALIATSFYIVQRTSRARLAGELSPWFVLLGFNLFCILAVTGYLYGATQSREYAGPEWSADIWLVIVWVTYFGVFVRTLARRAEPHIYVANWYFLAFIVVIAMLHIVNNLAIPVALFSTKSYSLFGGVQDAMTVWWYGHNAVGFLLTAGFLGMMYYFLPKKAERPIFSYPMSIVGFWGITFFYIWVGSHHLHFTALPDWVQTLGMTFSMMLIVPSWASVANGILTLNGAWDKVRTDPALRFMMLAVAFYAVATLEGTFMAMKTVNALSHYTDWTIGHVHAGALGWVGFITFGTLYTLVPWLWKRDMYSSRLVEWHFWLAVLGSLIYVMSMWNSGITQGLMWRTYDGAGNLSFSFVDTVIAMHPYYVSRAVGGLVYFIGAALGAYNIWKTISGGIASTADTASADALPVAQPAE